MTADTTVPVAPSGGTQSLAGSPTYDTYANTQIGRLSRIVALHVGVPEPSAPRMLVGRLAELTRKAPESDSCLVSIEAIGFRPLVKDIALTGVGGSVLADPQKAIDILFTVDDVIPVSPVFQASYSELFKSTMDVLPTGMLEGVPVPLGATAGTVRYNLVTEMVLRPLVVYTKALSTQTVVPVASEDSDMA